MWALIKKSYRYLTIIFLFSWDYSETQMVAFYQRSFRTQLINWNKDATSDLDLLYPTCPILPYTILYTILNLIFLIEPKGLAKLANIAC